MVGVLGISLDYVTRCDILVVWTAENDHNHLKNQRIQIVPVWEANK